MAREWRWKLQTRFPGEDADPLAGMASLVDVMLVFACGLIAALVAGKAFSPNESSAEPLTPGGVTVERGKELPAVPQSLQKSGKGKGLETVGTVYRDPETGKLVLVGD